MSAQDTTAVLKVTQIKIPLVIEIMATYYQHIANKRRNMCQLYDLGLINTIFVLLQIEAFPISSCKITPLTLIFPKCHINEGFECLSIMTSSFFHQYCSLIIFQWSSHFFSDFKKGESLLFIPSSCVVCQWAHQSCHS